MDIATWVLLGILSACFFAVGVMVLALPRDMFLHKMGVRADWDNAVPHTMYKLSGVFEILGAVGLVLPLATGIAKDLVLLAAVALIALMGIAIGVHIGIRDSGVSMYKPIVLTVGLVVFLALKH
ncbi:MAG TPA: DoxX family protein [Acidimicrobiia bacterium]|nr:DoxX family protein [Acidimicrobiia bacterium]